MSSLYARLADLPVTIEEAALERTSVTAGAGWERITTTVVLRGQGHEGRGEDITYQSEDHAWFPQPGELGLDGSGTFDELSRRLDGARLFEGEPAQHASTDYRRWGLESALLDLALRQAGQSLGDALGREYRPVRFAISTSPIQGWLEHDPGAQFKIDAHADWDDETMAALAATGAVSCVDLKAHYHGTIVDNPFDAALYRGVAKHFADAIIEDADTRPEALEILTACRLSFDAPVHDIADLDGLPPIEVCNLKPSRFGSVRKVLEFVESCEQRGIDLYCGGQFELGVGRAHVQAIASLVCPDAGNDVAPGEYNLGSPRAGLPRSPLPAPAGGPGIAPGT